MLGPSIALLLAAPSFAMAWMNEDVANGLKDVVSKEAKVVDGASGLPRWSEYGAPRPGTIVDVACEDDVLKTVQYCVANNVSFLAQNGGNGWTKGFSIGEKDVVINLAGLDTKDFCESKTEVTIGGGVIIRDLVSAAYDNDVQVLTGNCNCVGVLGAALGGGYSRLQGTYGLGIDNFKSMNLVTPEGELIHVTPKKKDLWFALRGAGANFGIVTSATLKTYPVPRENNGAWLGPLIFKEDKIEAIIETMNNLEMKPPMAIFLYFTAVPNVGPAVIVFPFHLGGSKKDYRSAFADILDLGPVANQIEWQPYNIMNAGSEPFCIRGGRKPAFGAGLSRMDPCAVREIWNEYSKFVKNPGTNQTAVLMEKYPLEKAKSFGDGSAAYPFRASLEWLAVAIPWYEDTRLDEKAEEFGSKIRQLWRSTSGFQEDRTYINYAYGDEPLETIYGHNVARLRQLKRQYDPKGRFNQFFPLS